MTFTCVEDIGTLVNVLYNNEEKGGDKEGTVVLFKNFSITENFRREA